MGRWAQAQRRGGAVSAALPEFIPTFVFDNSDVDWDGAISGAIPGAAFGWKMEIWNDGFSHAFFTNSDNLDPIGDDWTVIPGSPVVDGSMHAILTGCDHAGNPTTKPSPIYDFTVEPF